MLFIKKFSGFSRSAIELLILACACAVPAIAADEKFPTRPTRMFVASSAGAGADIVSVLRKWISPRLACLMLSAFAFWPHTLYAENQISIHEVATRPGVTVRVLMIKPERPIATILLFPGGIGRVTFQPDGSTGYRGFPVRKPDLFAQQGFVTAVVNAPSDVPDRHFASAN